MVGRIREMLDLAGAHRALQVEVDGARRAPSAGVLFVPPWLLNNGNGQLTNFFTDAGAIAAQQRLFAALGAGLGKHPGFARVRPVQ